ncbi:hypothetical protein F7R19_17660, partial [Cupriavidus pauculus]
MKRRRRCGHGGHGGGIGIWIGDIEPPRDIPQAIHWRALQDQETTCRTPFAALPSPPPPRSRWRAMPPWPPPPARPMPRCW